MVASLLPKALLMLVGAVIVGTGYSALKKSGYLPPTTALLTQDGEVILATPDPYTTSTRPVKEVPYKVEEFVQSLNIPWKLVFTSSDRLLVTERGGTIRAVLDGKLQEKALITFEETAHVGEAGLLGMVADPNYQSNKYLYVDIAYRKDGRMVEKIVRLKDLGATIAVDTIIMDNIPAAQFHDGGTLKFGPDGKLYISTGDATNKTDAQKLDSLAGKILRINADGSVPSDNPFPNSPVWSYGHRNPQGFDWYPDSRVMYATEHGPSSNDGPPGGDEVNVIEAGNNYGWPEAHHEIEKEGMVNPKILFTPAFAPASGMFYKGRAFPQFYGNFFFGGLAGQGIMRVVVEQKGPSKVLSYGKIDGISVGRVRDVVEGPDGYIYFATSNRDGRGSPRAGDDKIYRLVPDRSK